MSLSRAVGNAALGEVIGRQLNGDPVTPQNTNIMLAHFSGNMGGNHVPIVQFDTELGVGKVFQYGSFHLNMIFFCHNTPRVDFGSAEYMLFNFRLLARPETKKSGHSAQFHRITHVLSAKSPETRRL